MKFLIIFIFIFSFATNYKVSYDPDYAPFTFVANNKATGLLIDLWRLWAKKTNNTLTFVKAKSWDDALLLAKEGKVDFFVGTDPYAKWMKSSYTYYQIEATLFTLKKTKKIDSIAIVGNDYRNIVRDMFPRAKIISVDTYKQLFDLLMNKKVDAVFDDNLALLYYTIEHHINYLFIKHSKYSHFTNVKAISNSKDKIKIFNEGLKKISIDEFEKIEKNWVFYSDDDYFESTTITPKEIDYIKNNPILKVCINPDWAPIEYKYNKPMGVSIDVLNLINKKLQFKIEYIDTKNWAESLEYLKDKKCDILPSAMRTIKREKFAFFTKPYLEYDTFIITKKNQLYTNMEQLRKKTIARKEGSVLIDLIKDKYPNINIINTDSMLASFDLVNKNRVDATIATLPVFKWYQIHYDLDNLQISSKTLIKLELSIAVRDDKPILFSILNKSLSKIPTSTIDMINQKELSFKVIHRTNWKLYFITISIFLIIISIILYLYFQMKKAKQEADKANQAKSEFLANMSHEIRTPLNAMFGFIKILQNRDLDKTSKEYLEIIYKAGQNLLIIINDILDLSKIESHKLIIEKVPVDINKEVNHIYKLYLADAYEKNIKLKVNMDKIDKYIITDPVRLKQIIINLLSNAIKFSPKNSTIIITVKLKEDKLFIGIKDEGIGIDESKQKKIFEAFAQADTSTTREYGGTGLGLTISYKLVSLLGGELKLKSGKGKGSEFYFEIPAKFEDKIVKEKQIPHNKKDKFDIYALMVEDNQANQMFMGVILKQMGIKFDIAKNGLEAVNLYKQNHNKYDVILMDENMPIMNGIEASKKIIAYEKENNIPHTPIIAVTANALKGDEERFLEIMDEYIPKPIDIDKLKEVLSKYF